MLARSYSACDSAGFQALPQCQRRCLDPNMARQTHGAYMCNGGKRMLECVRNLIVVGEMNIAPCTPMGLWSIKDEKQNYPGGGHARECS